MCVLFTFPPLPSHPHPPPFFRQGPGVDPQVAGEPLFNTAGAHHYQRRLRGSNPRRASRQVVSGARRRRRGPSEKGRRRDWNHVLRPLSLVPAQAHLLARAPRSQWRRTSVAFCVCKKTKAKDKRLQNDTMVKKKRHFSQY